MDEERFDSAEALLDLEADLLGALEAFQWLKSQEPEKLTDDLRAAFESLFAACAEFADKFRTIS